MFLVVMFDIGLVLIIIVYLLQYQSNMCQFFRNDFDAFYSLIFSHLITRNRFKVIELFWGLIIRKQCINARWIIHYV